MNIFFCDIIGTFYENEIDENEIKKLIKNINELANIDNVDKTIFSFVSSENIEYVSSFVEILKNFLNDRIILGMQFSSNYIMEQGNMIEISNESKSDQILYALKNNDIKNIYFADDMLINHLMVNNLINEICPNMKIINIIPGTVINEENMIGTKEKGLFGVNKILNGYIEKSMNVTKTH